MDNNIGHTVIMDLFNNSIGRSIASDNPGATDQELMQKIIDNRDRLIY